VIVIIPRHFKYTQQPHCSQDADAERAVFVEERPDHFEKTSCYYLPVSQPASFYTHNAQSLDVDIQPLFPYNAGNRVSRINNDLDW